MARLLGWSRNYKCAGCATHPTLRAQLDDFKGEGGEKVLNRLFHIEEVGNVYARTRPNTVVYDGSAANNSTSKRNVTAVSATAVSAEGQDTSPCNEPDPLGSSIGPTVDGSHDLTARSEEPSQEDMHSFLLNVLNGNVLNDQVLQVSLGTILTSYSLAPTVPLPHKGPSAEDGADKNASSLLAAMEYSLTTQFHLSTNPTAGLLRAMGRSFQSRCILMRSLVTQEDLTPATVHEPDTSAKKDNGVEINREAAPKTYASNEESDLTDEDFDGGNKGDFGAHDPTTNTVEITGCQDDLSDITLGDFSDRSIASDLEASQHSVIDGAESGDLHLGSFTVGTALSDFTSTMSFISIEHKSSALQELDQGKA
ncbi:hypothetical protein THAOC_00207 [Thalassiosira oceanica]|uniref:Uncharacterized protein n=1 Tax=Thalassiosira oceanica TaxID=159749 RepID=K0TRJ9_THAOC|nr:hypothetical protein THAOC_00207 [Thalassiosira oceanica]|eukprot:EJK77927.1 hypothetical protein THAOC_00207 [Thalassiosira oceanica]